MRDDNFATLRELLLLEPSKPMFRNILELFNKWKESESRDAGLAYAEQHLDTWDLEKLSLRVGDYWRGFPEGQPSPCYPLVRAVNFRESYLLQEQVHLIQNSPYMANIRILHMGRSFLSGAAEVFALESAASVFRTLHSLYINDNDLQDEGVQVLGASSIMKNLT